MGGAELGAVWARAKASLRAHWRSWAVLTVLAGLAGGVATTAAAGARRTETAYPRFVKATHGFDVFYTNTGTGANPGFDLGQAARLPEVVEAVPANYYIVQGRTDAGRELNPNNVAPMGAPDGRFGAQRSEEHTSELQSQFHLVC